MSPSNQILLQKITELARVNIPLPASKSESNRALIMHALAARKSLLHNISEARDTKTMQRLLASPTLELDVLDAGTTMRFLTAYCAVTGKRKIIRGTKRMHERPIKLLVDALIQIGADIKYLEQEGFPPIEIMGMNAQKTNHIQIRGDVSSQYISALLMIAPLLPHGLFLKLTGNIGSKPYIDMTLSLMEEFGIKSQWEGSTIFVPNQPYKLVPYTIESDWSGASYWFSLVALAQKAEIKLLRLKKNSLQGDIKIIEIMENLGVATEFTDDGIWLRKTNRATAFTADFTNCPDLAQTVAVTCAAKGISCQMTGLESLRIKETDRIFALQQELAKIDAQLQENGKIWKLIPAEEFKVPEQPITVHTYEDHRMAMAFAPLVAKMDVIIEDPDVVNKSYPGFWNDLKLAGIHTSIQNKD